MSQAQAPVPRNAPSPEASSNRSRSIPNPLEELSLQETLRVMDVAREMRDRRETAEEMFRRDDLRTNLRDKLMRTARMSGEDVTEAEIDAAIRQYMDTQHVFHAPESGWNTFVAHCWIARDRIAMGLAAAAALAGTFWFMFA